MTTKCDPIFKMLQKHNDKWDEKCQVAFDKMKEYLTNALVLVSLIRVKYMIFTLIYLVFCIVYHLFWAF